MRERKDEIMEVVADLIPKLFEESSTETARFCEERSSEIIGGFLETFTNVMEQAAQKLKNDGERKIHYFLFSYLHSSIFLKKYLIRIDLMGPEFYMEEPLATLYWDAEDIYSHFEQDIEDMARKVAERVPRLRGYEVDYIRYAYAPYYHRMAEELIREIVGGILECSYKSYEDAGEDHIKILFGEYMGEADILYNVGKENMDEIFQNLCG